MSTTITTAVRHAALNAVAGLFDGATLTIRTGAAPGAAMAATGTVLATAVLPTPAFDAASGGVVAAADVFADASADASGTAQHFRLVGTGGAILEGTVTATGGGGVLELVSTSIVAGQPVQITAFTLSLTNG